MWKELRLPDPVSWSLKQNGIIYVNQRVRLPTKTRSRLTEKLAKCGKTRVHHTSYMPGNTRKKPNIYTRPENGMTKCISQQRIFWRLVQRWWTTRWDIIRIGQQGMVFCGPRFGQTIFPLLIFMVAEKQKTRSGHARLCARVAMEEG